MVRTEGGQGKRKYKDFSLEDITMLEDLNDEDGKELPQVFL